MKNNIQSSVLVAVDMGSQSFRAMAAEMTPSGALRVLGVEESSQKCCVHRGVVENTSDAGYMLTSVIKLLGNRIRKQVGNAAFICVGGQSMKVGTVPSTRDLGCKREITSDILAKMEWECKEKLEKKHPDIAVLDLIPSYFRLDGTEQSHEPSPNQRAEFLEGYYNAFCGKKELEEKVEKTFQRTALVKEKMYVRPEVLMNALTSEEEMKNGCAVLDLGAQTSTLTIHKGGEYLYNQVVPLGGYDITEAVEQLGISLMQAERLKCIYGVACADMLKVNRTYLLTNPEGEKISVSAVQLAEVISGKLAEMLTPLMEALNKETGIEILYVTGGGAMLNGIVGYIQRMTSVKVMGGSHAAWLTADTPDEYCMPQYASLVGTLLLGAEYRKTHPQTSSYSGNKPLIEKIKERTLILFTDQGEEGKK